MGKGLLIAMLIAAVVFGGLMLINHSSNNSFVGVSANPPSPTPMHLVVATSSSALQTPETADTPVPTASVTSQVATQAAIETSKGTIVLTLYPDVAPKTVANFVKKAQTGYYTNLTFHRVEDWVIQGGDPKGDGTGGGNMPTELNDKPFVTGSLGVARGGDINISNDSQFFITKSDATWLNKQYTNFGIVKSGMDVVNKIAIGDKILGITLQ